MDPRRLFKIISIAFLCFNDFLIFSCRVGVNEDAATQDLKQKIYSKKEELLMEFKKQDASLQGFCYLFIFSSFLQSIYFRLFQVGILKKSPLNNIVHLNTTNLKVIIESKF